jgi:MFS superfamily sulfate permease-like transporter
VQAGATSRLSTILHGAWILGFVALLPWLLREIPMAALGGILVITGWRLVSLAHVKHLFHRYGPLPALIWAATLITVVAEDLLTGVLVGLGLSLLELVPHMRRLGLGVRQSEVADVSHVALHGSATFFTLPKLNQALDSIPHGRDVTVDVGRLSAIDHTSAEMLNDWLQRRRQRRTRRTGRRTRSPARPRRLTRSGRSCATGSAASHVSTSCDFQAGLCAGLPRHRSDVARGKHFLTIRKPTGSLLPSPQTHSDRPPPPLTRDVGA